MSSEPSGVHQYGPDEARADLLAVLAEASRDPDLPPERRAFAAWMAGEMVSARMATPQSLFRGMMLL